MKCRICGVRTQNNEDICEKCYEEENGKKTKEVKSNKVLLDLKRKYKIKYMLFKTWEVFFVLILAGIMTGKPLGLMACLLLLVVVECFLLIYEKRKSKATKCKFYKNKVEYSCNFGLTKVERKINYKDLDTPNTTLTPNEPVLDIGGTVPKKVHTTVEEFVRKYVDYCNAGEYESAYAMISEECKQEYFGSVYNYKKYIYPKKYTINI